MVGGLSVGAAQERMADEHDVEIDLTELVEALSGLGFVASIDGEPLPDPAADRPPGHFRRLTERHVVWLFSLPMKALWLGVVATALVTLALRTELIPSYSDFFWSDYVGLTVLVNTVVGATVTLSAFGLFTAPIVIGTLVRAVRGVAGGLTGGSALTALDSGLLLLIEGGIQTLFVVTFVRGHRHWFRRTRSDR